MEAEASSFDPYFCKPICDFPNLSPQSDLWVSVLPRWFETPDLRLVSIRDTSGNVRFSDNSPWPPNSELNSLCHLLCMAHQCQTTRCTMQLKIIEFNFGKKMQSTKSRRMLDEDFFLRRRIIFLRRGFLKKYMHTSLKIY